MERVAPSTASRPDAAAFQDAVSTKRRDDVSSSDVRHVHEDRWQPDTRRGFQAIARAFIFSATETRSSQSQLKRALHKWDATQSRGSGAT